MKPKIQVLFCGGTMVMAPNRGGVLAPLSLENALHSVLSLEPRISQLADLDLAFISNIDSSDMTPVIWDQLALKIVESYDQYDGFVVIHGTDTMAYTASAVTFALQGLGKPVVFTGAQIPGHQLESDARRNFVNAIRLATFDLAEVVILFGDRILRGVRASKISHAKLNAFSSVNSPKLGEVGTSIQILREVHQRHDGSLCLKPGFATSVASLSLVPGMPAQALDCLLDLPLQGIVLNAYGTGNIPGIYLPFLKRAREAEVSIVIRTQCLEGATHMGVYATGKLALEYDAIEAHDMSLEATLTKLMWVLNHTESFSQIKTMMQYPYAREINPN